MVPLSEREIPIIADDYVDMEFGTGALKITPGERAFCDDEVMNESDITVEKIVTAVNQSVARGRQPLNRPTGPRSDQNTVFRNDHS